MTFAVGSLVRARGREWVVLPQSTDDMLLLRPLAGSDIECTGIYLPAGESVSSATFALPNPDRVGDHHACRLLRDAVRLGIRSSAGPFRSFGAIAVEPRPYQLVPLLLALRQDPVRLLIADDVGIGKTVEASLIAKELIERNEVNGMAVLVPPHLAEQWQRDLQRQFHIETELVLSSTAARLERGLLVGQSLFDKHRFTVVSLDFIKSPRRRDEFLRSAPNFVIVDEAHACAAATGARSRQLRHELLQRLASVESRHLLLVTATPHSGNEDAFRSLLGLLSPDLANLPADLTGPQNETHRRRLAQFLVQRRRPDIKHFLQEDTPFPERIVGEATYDMSPDHRRFFEKALDFARESVEEAGTDRRRQRVRWWSALALLRSVGSSPAAAAATLRNRAPQLDAETPADADEIGERVVLDHEEVEEVDLASGSDFSETESESAKLRRRLNDLAREVEAFSGPQRDKKLARFLELLQKLVEGGSNPIVFCRFIATAEYVAEHARKRLGKSATVACVTGSLPPEDREARVAELADADHRVLVCTDCLSEGINLQHAFDAVVHYDLSWNPTRHEQREGRVDRFNQPKKEVHTLLYYGANNPIDGLVLDVLLRKHAKIRLSTGVSVPVPSDTTEVMKALAEGLLLRSTKEKNQGVFEFQVPNQGELHEKWERAGEREKRSRTLFAQESIKPAEVEPELAAARRAVGSAATVKSFVQSALRAYGASFGGKNGELLDLQSASQSLRDLLDVGMRVHVRFELPVKGREELLLRTHPLVERLATYTLQEALDDAPDAIARRSGVIRTNAVTVRTTLLVLRERYHILREGQGEAKPLLAEQCGLIAFRGAPTSPEWLDEAAAEKLLDAEPKGNVHEEQAAEFASQVVAAYTTSLVPHLDAVAKSRADALAEAHRRVRTAAKWRGVRWRVEPKLPLDLVGFVVLLPAPA